MPNNDRFVDPFDLPEELKVPLRGCDRSIDLYDLDLHDEYDWLAQPYVEVAPLQERDGQRDES